MPILLDWFCWMDSTLDELQLMKDIECYDKIMKPNPDYPTIWRSNLGFKYKKVKECLNKTIDIINRKIVYKSKIKSTSNTIGIE